MLKTLGSSISNLIRNASQLTLKNVESANTLLKTTPYLRTFTNSLSSQLTSSPSKLLLKPTQQNLLMSSSLINPRPEFMQVRFSWGYKGRMMLKDIKRRELLRKFAPERIRLQALRANTILPKVLKVISYIQIYL
jgi:hypothetical protein